MNEYLSSANLGKDLEFAAKDERYLTIIKLGLAAFLPIVLISYVVGGIWEALFAVMRGHEISEGFLVTGILYPRFYPRQSPTGWQLSVFRLGSF